MEETDIKICLKKIKKDWKSIKKLSDKKKFNINSLKRMQICRNKLILDESDNKFVNDKLMINLTGLLKTKIVF